MNKDFCSLLDPICVEFSDSILDPKSSQQKNMYVSSFLEWALALLLIAPTTYLSTLYIINILTFEEKKKGTSHYQLQFSRKINSKSLLNLNCLSFSLPIS
uniref:Uncharacterized protein n=1 Tax=Cacopsylla melanoneura TaxID=428564 RepID=A0A8D8YPC6_9HEMI